MNTRLPLLFPLYSSAVRRLRWPALVLVLQVSPLLWGEQKAWGEQEAWGGNEEWGDWAQEVEQTSPAGQHGPGAMPGPSDALEAPERAQFEDLDGSDLGDYGPNSYNPGDHDGAQATAQDHNHTLLQQMEQLELLERMEQSLGAIAPKVERAQEGLLLRTQSIESIGTRVGDAIEALTPADQDFNKSEVLDNFVSQFENLRDVTGNDTERDIPDSTITGSSGVDDEGVTLVPDLDKDEDATLSQPGFDTLNPELEHPVKD